MANYNLVMNSQYSPFTMDELIKPAMLATQAHIDMENKISELYDNIGDLERLSMDEGNKEAYNRYKDIMNEIESQSAELSSRGMSEKLRKGFLDLKRNYKNTIVPIRTASEYIAKKANEQNTLRLADDTVRFDKDFSDSGEVNIDSVIANPNLTYNTVSGKSVETKVADEVAKLKDQYLEDFGKGREGQWKETADGRLIEKVSTTGLTLDDVQKIINNPEAYPMFNQIMSDAINSTGALNWENGKDMEQYLLGFAQKGLLAGIGKTSSEIRNNPDYMDEYTRWKWDREKKDAELKDKIQDQLNQGYTDDQGFEFSEIPLQVEINDNLDNYENYKDLEFNTEGELIGNRIREVDKLIDMASRMYGKEDYINRRKNERKELIKELKNYTDPFLHLNKDPLKAIELGQKIENSKYAQQKFGYSMFNFDKGDTSTDYNNYLEYIYSNISNPDYSGVYNEEGEMISRVPSKDSVEPVFTSQGVALRNKKTHKLYYLKFSTELDNIAEEAKAINNFIYDFSKQGTIDFGSDDDNVDLIDLSNEEIRKDDDLKDKHSRADFNNKDLAKLVGEFGKYIHGRSVKGVVIKDENGVLHKVVMYKDKDDNIRFVENDTLSAAENRSAIAHDTFRVYSENQINKLRNKKSKK